MTRRPRGTLLSETVDLLIRHFGAAAVQKAVEQGAKGGTKSTKKERPTKVQQSSGPSVGEQLELIKDKEPSKHELLERFHDRLVGREVLRDAQDIRHFAREIGVKGALGKSRRDMVPNLMKCLMRLPFKQLEPNIKRAEDISEANRGEGFAILTDKLVGELKDSEDRP